MAVLPIRFSEAATCPTCRREFGRLAPSGECWACADVTIAKESRTRAAAVILADLIGETDKRLAAAGMDQRERLSERARTTEEVRRVLPADVVRPMLEGRIPTRGFGLWGSVGVGKSGAIAALAKCYATATLEARAPVEGDVPMDLGIEWCSWLREAEWLRTNGAESYAIDRRMRRLCTVPILVLDDLARESRRRHHSEDFVAGKLDLVVSVRSSSMLPTLWTSNLGPNDLAGVYDGATVSRLEGENPGIEIRGKDRRLAG